MAKDRQSAAVGVREVRLVIGELVLEDMILPLEIVDLLLQRACARHSTTQGARDCTGQGSGELVGAFFSLEALPHTPFRADRKVNPSPNPSIHNPRDFLRFSSIQFWYQTGSSGRHSELP